MSRDLRYTHTFERYFQDGITRVDRLDQILRYGILSQREAQKNGIPYESPLVKDQWYPIILMLV